MTFAPVALFTFNRFDHTRRTIEALQRNELAEMNQLFIFSDGPRNEDDRAKVAEVRAYLKTVSGFKSVTVIEREINLGLANSIIAGVTEVVGQYGRIIVLEDDMVTSPYFLRFMNEALELYRDEEMVISVHGYVYPVKTRLPETFFLKGADCWGWATWKRGWDLFEPDGKKLLEEIRRRNLQKEFDLNGTYLYTKMLEDQISGRNDSWAVRWHASAFLLDKLTLYPGRSLVHNIGIDDSGTHCGATNAYDTDVSAEPVKVLRIPIEENGSALQIIERHFKSSRQGVVGKIKGKITKFLL